MYLDSIKNKSAVSLINKYNNLLVIRSTTKSFGLPSMRLGMLIGNKEIMKKFISIKLPYETSLLSQKFIEYFLDNSYLIRDYAKELYEGKDKLTVQKYIIKEIKHIYASQGQNLNDKHVELIVKQMFSRVLVTDIGDTELLPGEIITTTQFRGANKNTKGKKAKCETLLLGITKASLASDSFLSAASFQETARVLIDAAVSGKVDNLRGLKENVIIGKKIPAGTGYSK